MGTVLEELATTADQVADNQRNVARRARAMQRRRDRGWSWSRILDQESSPGLLALLRGSVRRLGEVSARFTQALARALTDEGESRRQVARRFGVSHQRVSALLRGKRAAPGNGGPVTGD